MRFSKTVKLAKKTVIYGSKCSAEIKHLRVLWSHEQGWLSWGLCVPVSQNGDLSDTAGRIASIVKLKKIKKQSWDGGGGSSSSWIKALLGLGVGCGKKSFSSSNEPGISSILSMIWLEGLLVWRYCLGPLQCKEEVLWTRHSRNALPRLG